MSHRKTLYLPLSAPLVGSLNWPHNWPMRSCITLVSVMRTPPPPPG